MLFRSSTSNGASGRDEANETVQIALASDAYSDQLMQIDYVVTGTATSGTDYTLNNGVASLAIEIVKLSSLDLFRA